MPAQREIVLIGDVHAQWERLDTVLAGLASRPQPLVCLLTGDVGMDPPWDEPARSLNRGTHDDSVREALSRVRTALSAPALFVPGNHDMRDTAAAVTAANLDGRTVEAGGLRIAGLGGAGPARFGFPYEWSEREADERLAELLGDGPPPDVLLSHTPPARSTLDRTAKGMHVGSRAVRRWIDRSRPKLFVCGHIHESSGLARIGGVPCLNAGALGEPYGRAMAWVVGWNDGPVSAECLVWQDGAVESRAFPATALGAG